jgi:hypothetical protein
MPNERTARYVVEIKTIKGGRVLFTAADWSDEERRIAFAQIMRLESRTVDSTTCLYWIDVKDEQGVGQLFTTADWNDDDRRFAVSEICRLAGVWGDRRSTRKFPRSTDRARP